MEYTLAEADAMEMDRVVLSARQQATTPELDAEAEAEAEMELSLAADWKRQQAATATAVRQRYIDEELDRDDVDPFGVSARFADEFLARIRAAS